MKREIDMQKEIEEIFSKEELVYLKQQGYSERDFIGLATMKRMLDMRLTEEQIDKVLFHALIESLEEYCDFDTLEDLRRYQSFSDMINKGELDMYDEE